MASAEPEELVLLVRADSYDRSKHQPLLVASPRGTDRMVGRGDPMDVTDAVTLAGDVILTATLVVFMFQARAMTKTNQSSVYQTVADQMMSIDRLFIDRPDLRPYFYGGKPAPAGGDERERVIATSELIVDFMDNVMMQEPNIPDYLTSAWQTYFRSIAADSPSIREFWRENRRWYDARMAGLLDEACLGADQAAPPSVPQQSDVRA
jgi:hypothetical protein